MLSGNQKALKLGSTPLACMALRNLMWVRLIIAQLITRDATTSDISSSSAPFGAR
ncbi:hypothetical protein D3C84_1255640 [compost metagenome]